MTSGLLQVALFLIAVGAAAWSGLFALAQEAPGVARGRGELRATGTGISVYRALQASRLSLLLCAGAAITGASMVGGGTTAAGTWGLPIGLAFIFMLGDALPRGAAALNPQLSSVAVLGARKSLVPFLPLVSFVAAVERVLALIMPPMAHRRGIGQHERDMLAGVISLSDTQVADIMTPRLDIVAVDVESDWPAMVEILRRSEHARLPVYAEDLDEIVGVLYAKDLTPAVAGIVPRPPDWRDLIRPPAYVPESKSLATQLRDFQRGPAHLAIVVDEFGGTSGLITLEDVLEEVVGEIYGEYDREAAPPVESEGTDRYWVAGSVTLDTLSGALGTLIERDDVSTVGGLVYSELGRVPRPGEELRIAGFRVVVERVVRRRVQRVYFEREGTVGPGPREEQT